MTTAQEEKIHQRPVEGIWHGLRNRKGSESEAEGERGKNIFNLVGRRRKATKKSSEEEHRVDAKAPTAEEGRGQLRKATGSCKQATIRGYPNGGTRPGQCLDTRK